MRMDTESCETIQFPSHAWILECQEPEISPLSFFSICLILTVEWKICLCRKDIQTLGCDGSQ